MSATKLFLKLSTLFVLLFAVNNVQAATFSLEPSSGNLIRGCPAQIVVKMNSDGVSSNGAQIYVNHSGVSGGSINIKGNNLFSTYSIPPGVPASTLGLIGYGNNVSGFNLNYATINVTPNSSAGSPFNLSILFNAGDITSKIAEYPSSENILTSVTNGSYTIIDGYCETQPPYITNLDPVADKPNHPVNQSIKFDLKDDGSGLDMSTFNVTVSQSGVNLPIDVIKTSKDSNDKWYAIEIKPINNLTPELKVVVTVTAKDKAGNLMNRTYQFNDLTCAQLGCLVGEETTIPQCRDGIDNDGDGKIDFPEDSGCSSPDDNNEFSLDSDYCSLCPNIFDSSTSTVIDDDIPFEIEKEDIIKDEKIGLDNLSFYLANRSVLGKINKAGVIEVLAGTSLTVVSDLSNLDEEITSIVLIVDEKNYSLYYDNGLKKYAVDILDFKNKGTHEATLLIKYNEDKQIKIPFIISVLNKGLVTAKIEQKISPISGVLVKLEEFSQGDYKEISSIKTDAQGNFGFVVANGEYRLIFEAEGYRAEQTNGFRVNNNIINHSTRLLEIVDIFSSEVTLGEKASYVAGVAQEQIKKIIKSADDPQFEKTAEKRIAPIATAAAVAATIPTLTTLGLLPYLQFLFLQPILLLGRKRRKKWGIVYNSLNKLPIDLAVVRLYNVKTNNLVQSRVTDSEGRYAFFVEPDLYRIEVSKPGFLFPTKILQDFREDTDILDLYHGEPVHVDEKYAAISANIPLDPIDAVVDKTPRRIKINMMLRNLQMFVASLSIAAGIFAVAIKPSVLTISLLVFQIAMYFLFKRLAVPPKPKNWGIVYEQENNKPVEKVVARLFSKQFDKLIATGITDSKGRYSFMVGPNKYYITFEKPGYTKTTSQEIAIKRKDELVKIDVPLSKDS